MSVTERRTADRRHETRTMPGPPADPPHDTMRANPQDAPVRDNPEVMGRKEPEAMGRKEPEAMTRRPGIWPDMTEFQARFEHIQSEFIEDPKSAVQKAERLMEEAIDRMTRSMHERMQSMRHDAGDDADTEKMRLTMRKYRDFIESLGGSRAA